jgi:thiosulfate/3-mercaptopyruvate sulfurtransferase
MAMDRFTTLIQARELASHRDDPRWVVLDCRFDLANPSAGRAAWQAGHIPGARYAHLDEDLSSPIRADTGRHPLPDPATLAGRLGAWGIDNDSQVVVYDAGNSAYAARAWWLLRWLGHEAVAVLDGGLAAWQRAGLPVDTEVPRPTPRGFVPRADDTRWLSTAAVANNLATRQTADTSSGIALVDARGADRFEGRNETIDPVAGHVPGARSHPFATNLDAEGRFLPADELRRRWSRTLGDTPPAQVASMCGSGVTACQNLLALEIAGLHGARLYAGSWSEWIRDPRRPVATGAA